MHYSHEKFGKLHVHNMNDEVLHFKESFAVVEYEQIGQMKRAKDAAMEAKGFYQDIVDNFDAGLNNPTTHLCKI